MTGYEGDVVARLSWDAEADAGYIELASVGPGEAVHQRVVPNPVAGLGDVILDFDTAGHLLGIELLGAGLLPPALIDPEHELNP